MPERLIFPEWRKANEATRYPFSDRATLVNGSGRTFLDGTFLDAALYPVGAADRVHVASVEVTHESVTFRLGDSRTADLASAVMPLTPSEGTLVFADAYGRPAGVIVSEPVRLGVFQSWGVGLHEFEPSQSEFCVTCCFPCPEAGVRAVRLDDGSLFAGEVWLVGGDGVVLRTEYVDLPADCRDPGGRVKVLRLDVVGDPLFRRRLCSPTDLFDTPRPVKAVRFTDGVSDFVCLPDATGNIPVTTGGDLAPDTILRIVPAEGGVRVSAVGL